MLPSPAQRVVITAKRAPSATRRQAGEIGRRFAEWTLATFWIAAVAGCGGFAAQGLNAEGVRLFDQTRYPEAMQQFQRAVDQDPQNADGYYNLAAAYHRLALVNGRPADVAQAERYYYLCLDRNPEHRECYRGLAVLLAQQSRAEEAFRLLQGWADRRPNSAEPKIELARLHEEYGDRKGAKQELADALLVDSANPRALAAMGRLRELDGDRAQALNNYQQSLAADQFQPDVATRVATIQSTGGGWQPVSAPSGGTQTVSRGAISLR